MHGDQERHGIGETTASSDSGERAWRHRRTVPVDRGRTIHVAPPPRLRPRFSASRLAPSHLHSVGVIYPSRSDLTVLSTSHFLHHQAGKRFRPSIKQRCGASSRRPTAALIPVDLDEFCLAAPRVYMRRRALSLFTWP